MWLRLNRYWRILGTAFCFSLFGLGGLLLSLFYFPLIYLLPISKINKKQINQRGIHFSCRIFIGIMRFLGVLNLTLTHTERLKNKENQLVIANHPSLIDVVLLITQMKQADSIVKEALYHNFFLKGVVKSAQYISNKEPQALLNQCVKRLQQGQSLIVFPEGTRTEPNQPIKFQRGAASVALQAKHSITPVIIICNTRSLTKGRKWYQVPRNTPIMIRLIVGEEIGITPFLVDNMPRSVATRQLTAFLEQYYQQEMKKYE